jgi:hypothetical protein
VTRLQTILRYWTRSGKREWKFVVREAKESIDGEPRMT